MNFLTFFLYFIASSFLYQLLNTAVYIVIKKYMKYKLEKDIKSGKIKMVTLQDLLGQVPEDGGDQTWN